MTTRVDTPQSRCRVAFARADITPPVGIYHRMWGALHDRRPASIALTATALWMEALDGSARQLVISLDHCLLDGAEYARVRATVGEAAGIAPDDVMVSMSHTHGSAWMSRARSHLPGGELIGPYLDQMTETCARIAKEARDAAKPATLLYGTARCSLAAHRDFWDSQTKQFVCGFNPDGPADDTVLLAKAVADSGELLGTVVNYACHPTTLAWENTLISPDYVGSMRNRGTLYGRTSPKSRSAVPVSARRLGRPRPARWLRRRYDSSGSQRPATRLRGALGTGSAAGAGDVLRVRGFSRLRGDSRNLEAPTTQR